MLLGHSGKEPLRTATVATTPTSTHLTEMQYDFVCYFLLLLPPSSFFHLLSVYPQTHHESNPNRVTSRDNSLCSCQFRSNSSLFGKSI